MGGVGGGGSRSCSRPHRRDGSCVPYISSCEISLLTLIRHRVGSRWLVKVVVRPGVATNGSGQRLKSGASYFCVCTSQQTASELPLTCVMSSQDLPPSAHKGAAVVWRPQHQPVLPSRRGSAAWPSTPLSAQPLIACRPHMSWLGGCRTVGVHNGTQEVLLISSSQHSAQFANQPDSESQPFLTVGLHGFGFG